MVTRASEISRASDLSDTVFSITELLESILTRLPMRDLLTSAQRVSHRWRSTVSSSPTLQRKLYRQPEPQERELPDRNRVANPLLKQALPMWHAHAIHTVRGDLEYLPMCRSAARKMAFLRPEASWRLMLVSQPPPLRLGCWMVILADPRAGGVDSVESHYFKIQAFPKGLRMGTLYDRTVHWLATCPSASFAALLTPKEKGTLRARFQSQSLERAIEQCAGSVDYVLGGAKRVEAPRGDGVEQKSTAFERMFEVVGVHDDKASKVLEPTTDSGYKSPETLVQTLEDGWDLKLGANV